MGFIDKVSAWGAGATASIATSASNLTTTAVSTAGSLSKAFQDASGLVVDQTNTNLKPLKKFDNKWVLSAQNNDLKELFPIGIPARFNKVVDPYNRFGNYLRSKMSVIDLIPVDYKMDFKKLTDIISSQKEAEKSSSKAKKEIDSIFEIGYGQTGSKIELFQKLCEHHGLPSNYAGIRLYTTDDTTSNDSISIQYKDSTFQGLTDGLSNTFQSFRDIANSVLGSTTKEYADKATAAAAEASKQVVAEVGGNEAMQKLTESMTAIAGDILMKGNKMTFPKIWQSTSYSGQLSVNIKLMSPYGHPEAIKEFILKPLSYLLLLAAPQTINGVTYGGSIPLTVKAYGLNYTIVGSINSITFRRGGSETAFNLYKQPLILDISIDFQTLFDAFAMFDPSVFGDSLTQDKNIFEDPMLTNPDNSLNLYTQANKNNLMTTLGTVLASFRPVKLSNMDIDPQVYGVFTPPSRDDIPDSPAFTPITGNLGSSISGAVDSIGKFANMVTNAPKLIQQGLSNAVYNTAKGSVGSIVGKASGWLTSSSSTITGVTTKVNSLFG